MKKFGSFRLARLTMLRTIFLCAAGSWISSDVIAQENRTPQPLSLIVAWESALAHDASLKAQRAQIEAAKERGIQASANNGPTVNASASLAESLLDTNRSQHRFSFNPSVGAQLTWPLYRPANLAQIEASKLQVLLSEAQLQQQESDLMIRVAQAYLDCLAAMDSLQLLQAQKRAISEQLASAKRNFEVGTATITDQQEAQARSDLVLAQELAAQNDLEVRLAALAVLTGVQTNQLMGLPSNAILDYPPTRMAALEAMIGDAEKSGSPYPVRLSRLATELARRDLERAKAGLKPTVDLVANGSISHSKSASGIGITNRSAAVGVQLNVPVFNGGLLDSRQREAVALLDKAENELLAVVRTNGQQTKALYKKLQSGLAQVRALQQAEKSSQLALDSNRLGYQVGVRINIDVLNAQQQLFSTQRDLARARYEVLLDELRLKQALGRLLPADLQTMSAQLTRARGQ